MKLTRLQVRHVRILDDVTIQPDARLNIIEGANASGKTSLLEAIHILAQGRSFRTRKTREVVNRDADALLVFGEGRENEFTHRLGVKKSNREKTEIHVDRQRVQGVSALAVLLPLLVITPESHALVSGGPSRRRALVDWGVFHVEQTFHRHWLTYERALRQRNALLKQGASSASLVVWEREMAVSGNEITAQRKRYVDTLAPRVEQYMKTLLQDVKITIGLKTGWGNEPFHEALRTGREKDERFGYTTLGPHRAELEIRTEGRPASEVVSRGQQKLMVMALRLAQLDVFQAATGRSAVLLIDDLPAELDHKKRDMLLAQLSQMDLQIFVTTTDAALIGSETWSSSKMFHVEHGRVSSRC
ncbi:DNA replication/repair protein RecF [Thiohalomonas denitrificans]|uniref:DNA replication and repair protein RecF n=1 Tax=Thiohalomonas denitrificans TaxID=415747 RepID=A0A1G5QUG9_9GAMM|nr:DNA replication/repair protein RecF [Thiohalomonas denitrificans]SCZ65228.1 DNA replication and repair protein RecF [Thiohalomonas denitrificans]